MSSLAQLVPIEIAPGIMPDTDFTAAEAVSYVEADKVRFVDGKPRKIGGFEEVTVEGSELKGCARTFFTTQIDDKNISAIGSSKGFYGLKGSQLRNLTPFKATPIAATASLDTHYDTLATDPVTVVDGSKVVTIADSEASNYKPGDSVTLSGATATGGVPAGDINKTHLIRTIEASGFTINVVTAATSDATGGGGSVVRTSGLLTVNSTAHGLTEGERVSIASATNTGGILAAEINTEFLIRNVVTNSFDVMTDGSATSSTTGGGGASTEYQVQIDDGACDESGGSGYGLGLYGVGLFGVAKTSDTRNLPRIWSMDRYGNTVVATPGNGEGVYQWDATIGTAPTTVSNAPTDINYLFVTDSILVTFGAGGNDNRILTSDQGDITEWTGASSNQVFDDSIEGAGRLLSHVNLNGVNLIFTTNQCYTFRYIGLPNIFEIRYKDEIGIIAPFARVAAKGAAYWMGHNNFYMWQGGDVEIIPCTITNYVFNNINRGQASKSFAWYNKRYDEIWFHYVSAGSNEPDRVARYNIYEKHWTTDTWDRTAAEYPTTSILPTLVSSDNKIYQHERGSDADDEALTFTLKTNRIDLGTNNAFDAELIPDSVQNGDLEITVEGYSYPQSKTAINSKTVTVSPDTEFVKLDIDGRYLQYTISGSELEQEWLMGKWKHGLQNSARRP
jgi:hypothetical protein